ncbi:hypothetical protein L5515_004060 [Caenorhabditis briggsae]|uniref:Uncharacterized protein n=1 Tax=Caenorhabditis briggsae TaxID=6238 RepID=A0AAE9DBU0_CAEBR|nr:hypothetical protein L3Y34_001203 [Caenorhabditis briggsae]UMM23245.1 hypothetical protein L5515_004060 [Caenorhabditis briggsae]
MLFSGTSSGQSSYNTNSVQRDSTGSSSSNQPGYLPDYQGDRYTDPQRIADTQALNRAFFDSIGGAPSPPPETPAQQGMNGGSTASPTGQYNQQQQQYGTNQQYNPQQQQYGTNQQYNPQQQQQYGSTTSYSSNGPALYATGTTNYPTLYQPSSSSPQYMNNGCTTCRFRRHFGLGPVKF